MASGTGQGDTRAPELGARFSGYVANLGLSRSSMRRVAVFFVVFTVLAGLLYVASPFRAAYLLRQAVEQGDQPALDERVDWEPVRASLKASLHRNAQLLTEVNAAGEAIQPTLWQRIKALFGATLVDRFVESYVTPEGLPKLFTYHRSVSQRLKGKSAEAQPAQDAVARLKAFYARIKRAEFQSLTAIEFEIADEDDPARSYASLFRLSGGTWKLTGLRIIARPQVALAQQDASPAAR